MLSSSIISTFISLCLVQGVISIPIKYSKADLVARSIADEAAAIENNIAYVECEVGQEAESAALSLGLSGVIAQKCVAPAVFNAPLAFTSPVAVTTPVIVVHQPVAIAAAPIAPAPAAVYNSNPLTFPTPNPTDPSLTADQLNKCTSTDPYVCYEQKLALEAHNVARRAHHVPDLVWNADLAAAALRWANHCTWGHSEGQLFPSDFVYGENVYAADLSEISVSTAIMAYTNEESIYDYNNPIFSEATGHFISRSERY